MHETGSELHAGFGSFKPLCLYRANGRVGTIPTYRVCPPYDIWREERAYLVVQLARAFCMYQTMQFGPRGCPRAKRKRNRPCLFRSPSMPSIQLATLCGLGEENAKTLLIT